MYLCTWFTEVNKRIGWSLVIFLHIFIDGQGFNSVQVNEKFCELKGRNTGIAEKAKETRSGMSLVAQAI